MNYAERLILWLLASAGATAAVAWVAFQIQQDGVAPAVLFPMLVGAAIGGAVVASGRLMQLDGRWALAIVAASCGLLAVVGQDYVGHRYRLRAYDAELAQSPLAVAAVQQADWRPTFGGHLADKLRTEPVWWMLDVLLTVGGAVAAALLGRRKCAAVKTLCPGEQRPLEGHLNGCRTHVPTSSHNSTTAN